LVYFDHGSGAEDTGIIGERTGGISGTSKDKSGEKEIKV